MPFHPMTSEYTLVSGGHRTLSRIVNILCHKTKINKLKQIQVIQSMHSDHNGIKLEINNREISGKFPST